jgi:hypothetical protein
MMSGQFRYPYPWTWDPDALQQGSPTIVNRGRNELGSRDFFLQSHRTQPSSASIISSFGMDLGVPSDNAGRPLTGALRLLATPYFDYEGFFYSGGVFASALTSAAVQMYLEESDARGNFVRGIDGPRFQILREDPPWFSGSATWTPHARNWVIPSLPSQIGVRANFSYRLWVDLVGEIRAAGYGGFGGSGSVCQIVIRVWNVDWGWERA